MWGVLQGPPFPPSSLVFSRAEAQYVLSKKGLADLKAHKPLAIPRPEHLIFTQLWE